MNEPTPSEDPLTVLLTRRAEGGDPLAFDDLYRRHFGRILRATAMGLHRLLEECQEDAEDAVHEAFTDAFVRLQERRLPDIHTPGAFRAYVARAASNAVLSKERKRQAGIRGGGNVRRRADLPVDDTGSLFALIGASGPSPSAALRQRELEAKLEQAMLDLPEPYRPAIELHCLCGMSYDEIADSGALTSQRTGEPISSRKAVKVVVFRARQKLGERLDGPEPPSQL